MREVLAWVVAALSSIAAVVMGFRFWETKNDLRDSKRARVEGTLESSEAETELAVIKETEAARADTSEGLAKLNQEIDDAAPIDPSRDIDDTLDRLGAGAGS